MVVVAPEYAKDVFAQVSLRGLFLLSISTPVSYYFSVWVELDSDLSPMTGSSLLVSGCLRRVGRSFNWSPSPLDFDTVVSF